MTPLPSPSTDPVPILDLARGNFTTELLGAAVTHLGVFAHLAPAPLSDDELRQRLGLAERPFVVLLTALRAMRLIERDSDGRLMLSAVAREHLVPDSPFAIADYVGLAAGTPGTKALVERLRTNKPANSDDDAGAAYIFREGMASAMEREASARWFTLALSGRAKNVAPVLAQRLPLQGVTTLVDVAGGTGIYAIACLRAYSHLRAVVLDRPEVLKVADEFAREYGVADRLELRAGDMFTAPIPTGEVVLLSNVLHDWDVPTCLELVNRCSANLPVGGRLVIHDVFLDDDLGGPLAIALYSAALFTLTEGRAYSAREYRTWLEQAGLSVGQVVLTLAHCGLLTGTRVS